MGGCKAFNWSLLPEFCDYGRPGIVRDCGRCSRLDIQLHFVGGTLLILRRYRRKIACGNDRFKWFHTQAHPGEDGQQNLRATDVRGVVPTEMI